MLATAASAAAAAATAAGIRWWLLREPNPFASVAKGEQLQEQRDISDLIRRKFSTEWLMDSDLYDAIVIGSGIGGLSAAALLSMAGKRVLVLEQHDIAGGCCHTYEDKGYEFDVGIHYVGEMESASPLRWLMDRITQQRLLWAPLEWDEFDKVVLRDSGNSYSIGADRQQLVQQLCQRFPDNADGIRAYFALADSMKFGDIVYWFIKLLPLWLAQLLLKLRLLHLLSSTVRYADAAFLHTVQQMGITDAELIAVLGYSFGDFGCPLARAPLIMMMGLFNHFQSGGGFYPVGGASSIASSIVPTIRAAGGDMLVQARVKRLLCSEDGSRVTGVQVSAPNGATVSITSKLVISSAGMRNTASLLPEQLLAQSDIPDILREIPSGISSLSLFIGLRLPQDEQLRSRILQPLRRQNIWHFASSNLAQDVDTFLALNVQEAAATDIPLLFLSFPSLKDPTWQSRRGCDRLTVTAITLVNWEWFSQWQDERIRHRSSDYRGIKAAMGNTMWQQVLALYPLLAECQVELFDIGSPVTNSFYINSPNGEIYGLDHGLCRTKTSVCARLRPDMGVAGLLLSGQDVAMCGFAGALTGGVLCASAALGRNLMLDLLMAGPVKR